MIKSTAAFAALASTFPTLEVFGIGKHEEGTLIPFLDAQPTGRPMLKWDQLTTWITPSAQLFAVSHYNVPEIDSESWRLKISGLVNQPRVLSLKDVRKRPRKEVIATLECSGNGSNPGFMGAIGNIRWTGTPLASLLKECGMAERAIEIVFFGADEKVEKIRDRDYPQNFARSLSRADALRDEVLLAYEMNGEPLAKEHGGPVRLIVPGWFGIAWVKWLNRIEVADRRFMSKYMAREYVTIRGEERDGKTVWRETSVGPIDVKSMVARAVRLGNGTVRLSGAAWTDGTPLQRVEVKIDGGTWTPVEIDSKNRAKFAWTLWKYDWRNPTRGDHAVVSRAIDHEGRIQPDADDSAIKLKRTYWEANEQHPRKLRIE